MSDSDKWPTASQRVTSLSTIQALTHWLLTNQWTDRDDAVMMASQLHDAATWLVETTAATDDLTVQQPDRDTMIRVKLASMEGSITDVRELLRDVEIRGVTAS